MKNFLTLLTFVLLVSCSKSDDNNNCNFLQNSGVNASINLNLPQYSQLQFTSNSVYIPFEVAGGNGGIIVTNVGSGLRAWDAADPSHIPSSCSIMTIDGANAKCGCGDENEYSLFIGQPLNEALPCGLKEYRVTPTGSNTYSITN
ncbi:hypothetical protein [Gaetbulibacter jejuensis]|uniref:Ferredoxin subunit of nitrite reductase or a ring-hydroxylating dioxygenase n=1 Tax=Gaetbulibacter jejuensis TaxID=584607 RepID=A0ABP3UQ42_9FLAO